MKRHPLRTTARIVSYVVFAMISLHLGADPVHADSPEADSAVIRYLNDHGVVRSFEVADALGFLKEKALRIESAGNSHGALESLAALASGSTDLIGAATPTVINAIASEAKI